MGNCHNPARGKDTFLITATRKPLTPATAPPPQNGDWGVRRKQGEYFFFVDI